MVWYGTVWYGVVWYGMAWCGMIYGMAWYGTVWSSTSLFCPVYLSCLSRIILCNVIYIFVDTLFCLNPCDLALILPLDVFVLASIQCDPRY